MCTYVRMTSLLSYHTSFPLCMERFLRAATAAVTVSVFLLLKRGTSTGRPPILTILSWFSSECVCVCVCVCGGGGVFAHSNNQAGGARSVSKLRTAFSTEKCCMHAWGLGTRLCGLPRSLQLQEKASVLLGTSSFQVFRYSP